MDVMVSVLMPARNAAKYVAAAARSVLAQEGVALELIVIDDGSTDGTRRVVEGIGDGRVRLVAGPQAGIAAAMNAGLAAARGRYVARCDADDLFPSGRLAGQAGWMEGHAEFAAVCGGFVTIDPKGRPACEMDCGTESGEITDELRSGRVRTHLCTFLIRTDALRQIGGFRSYFETSEDIDAQFRLGERGRVWFDSECAYLYRLHNQSITHAGAQTRREFFEAMARQLQTQRLTGGVDDVDAGRAPLPPRAEQSTGHGGRADEHLYNMLVYKCWIRHRAGQRGRALATGVRVCLARPGRLASWKNLVLLLVKRAGGEIRGSTCA